MASRGRPHLGRRRMHFVEDGLLGLVGALRRATGHDHRAAHANQLLASFKPDTCISPCDDIDFPSEVDFFKALACDVFATNKSCQSEVSSCAEQRWHLSTKCSVVYQGESGGLVGEEMRQSCEGGGQRSLQEGHPIVVNLHRGDAEDIQAEMVEETQTRPYQTHFLFTPTITIDSRLIFNQT
eukprot:scaffold9635_cov258-Ochromonas_danica.AAC.3